MTDDANKQITLKLSPEAWATFKEMQTQTGQDPASLVRDALRFYHWYLGKRACGQRLFVSNTDGETMQEIELEF